MTPKQILAEMEKGCDRFCLFRYGKIELCVSCNSKISTSKERWKEKLEFLEDYDKEQADDIIQNRIAELKEVLK